MNYILARSCVVGNVPVGLHFMHSFDRLMLVPAKPTGALGSGCSHGAPPESQVLRYVADHTTQDSTVVENSEDAYSDVDAIYNEGKAGP